MTVVADLVKARKTSCWMPTSLLRCEQLSFCRGWSRTLAPNIPVQNLQLILLQHITTYYILFNHLLIASKSILFQSSQSLGAGLHWFGGLAPGWTSKHLARSYDFLLWFCFGDWVSNMTRSFVMCCKYRYYIMWGNWLITPPPLNSWGVVINLFQLIMKRFFMCNWFFIAKCIGHYVLDFVLANVLLAAGCLLLLLSFSFSFLISFLLISSHFISFHPLSPVMFLQEMKWISTWKWINGKRNQKGKKHSQKIGPKKVGPLYWVPPLLISWEG